MPLDPQALRARVREGLQRVAERRGHATFAIGLRLLVDLDGLVVYACGCPGAVTPSAAALWETHPLVKKDEVMLDFLDTCRHILKDKLAGDYWADFLATIRGALLS
jgi:hypothetical protein